MADDLPQWAKERAADLVQAEYTGPWQKRYAACSINPNNPSIYALARYIAAHEEAPVDPLLIEAREIAASHPIWTDEVTRRDIRAGVLDDWSQVEVALAALRRGMELAK